MSTNAHRPRTGVTSALSDPRAAAEPTPGAPEVPLVAIIPAAGHATRISPLPCSKELLPVGYARSGAGGSVRPKVISSYLLDRMRSGGAHRAFIVTRPDKHDLMRYYGSGDAVGMAMAYLNASLPWGPPFSVAQALPFAGTADVLFGFPDILIWPSDAFVPVVQRLRMRQASVVLGLFECTADVAGDWVELGRDDCVVSLRTREACAERPPRHWCWMFAAWDAQFSGFLAAECRRLDAVARAGAGGPEWPMGALFGMALAAGLKIDGVRIAGGRFLDVGTPEGLCRAPAFPGVWDGIGAQCDADPGPQTGAHPGLPTGAAGASG